MPENNEGAMARTREISNLSLQTLPNEILSLMISFLPPEQIVNVILLNQHFNMIGTAHFLWRDKFKVHFGDEFDAALKTFEAADNADAAPSKRLKIDSTSTRLSWIQLFATEYKTEYVKLLPAEKRLLSIIKENDCESLDKLIQHGRCDLDKLIKIHNKEPMIYFAARNGHSSFLNAVYELAVDEYNKNLAKITILSNSEMFKSKITLDKDKRSILEWAIICHQPEETLVKILDTGLQLYNMHLDSKYHAIATAIAVKNIMALEFFLSHAFVPHSCPAPLVQAIENNDTDAVRILLKYYPDLIHEEDKNHNYPLYTAVYNGSDYWTAFLINAGANVELASAIYSSMTPLSIAASLGWNSIVTLLLNNGANPNVPMYGQDTPLMLATNYNKIEVVKTLLEHGILSDDIKNSIISSIVDNNIEILKLLLNSVELELADIIKCIKIVINSNNADILELLLNKFNNHDINHLSMGMIHASVENDSIDCLQVLINHGADIDLLAADGKTALAVCVLDNKLEMAKLLLIANANVHTTFFAQESLLHIASLNGNITMIKMLLAHGANPNMASEAGYLPLHIAAVNHQMNAVKFWLNMDIKLLPFDVSKYQLDREVKFLLLLKIYIERQELSNGNLMFNQGNGSAAKMILQRFIHDELDFNMNLVALLDDYKINDNDLFKLAKKLSPMESFKQPQLCLLYTD